jgi:thiol-disulfide isomerase/thioredoxin
MGRAFLRAIALTSAPLLALGVPGSALAGPGAADAPGPPVQIDPTPAPRVLGAPPWLGVTMDAGGDIGVTIEHVVRGSPADKGGLKAGDRIVGIDGVKTTAPGHVTRVVGQHKVGDSVGVDLERRGTATTASVVLAPRPSGDEILRMDLVGAPAPAWSKVTPMAGAPASIAALRGRVVLVDFWATWCGPCRMLAPRLSALKDKFGAQGLSVVGITTDDAEKAAVFAERNQMRYGVVIDKEGETSKAYGITALPTMLVVDKKGIIREVFIGYDPMGDARLEASLKALLAETAPAPAPTPAAPAPTAQRPPGR